MSRSQPLLRTESENAASSTGPLGSVLLVEDEDFVREITGEILEAEGYIVLKARSAEEARTAFRRHRKFVGLLVTDLVLPDQNGYELAEGLRNSGAEMPVIFMSGYARTIAPRALKQAATFYLPKPYTAESLLQRVREAFASEQANLKRVCGSLQPV